MAVRPVSAVAVGEVPSGPFFDALAGAGVEVLRGADLLPRALPAYLGVEAVGDRWLRLDTSAGSALVRAEPGVSLDHERGGLRVRTRGGREYVTSGVDEAAFDEVPPPVGAAANPSGIGR